MLIRLSYDLRSASNLEGRGGRVVVTGDWLLMPVLNVADDGRRGEAESAAVAVENPGLCLQRAACIASALFWISVAVSKCWVGQRKC